ncbi:MAG: stage II sporulation protein R [Clostridia bacterium]|nr:stage II sporulation protein R [Clostridia bacterium]
MKNRLMIIVLLIVSCCLCFACGDFSTTEEYLRIHIRANSNESCDQEIKYKIKDIVVDYLTPYIVECDSVEDVKNMINSHDENIESIIDNYLMQCGYYYKSEVLLNKEFFPTRAYENLTLEANYYDAIIINLGSGDGDNWWCVVYPPLCFKESNNVVYKSKILEIIKKIL